jgi:Protein of unknown function (DUF3788)
MSSNVEPPTKAELEAALGSAFPLWKAIVRVVEETCNPLIKEWKPSKSEFGRMCLLQFKKRTLLYITPDIGKVWVAIVLGERAFQLAMASSLPEVIKNLLLEAKPYAEGRGIRFQVSSIKEIPIVGKLLEIKTALT